MKFDLSGFRLISNQKGLSFLAVSKEGITFSKNVCTKLGNPSFVQLLIHDEKRQIVLRACEEKEPESLRFAGEGDGKAVFWNRRELKREIHKVLLGFDPVDDERLYIDGEYYDEDRLFLFNTRNCYTKREKDILSRLD